MIASVGLVSAQTMTDVSDIDPAAKKILDKMKKEYDSYSSMEVDFELEMELPGQATEVQKGKVIQQGEMYMVDMTDRAITSNGDIIWLHIKKNNEVQINDADMDEDETNMLSPKDMLNLYESGEYVYAITGESKVGSRMITAIDFKPLDRNSEFSKMTLSIDEKGKKLVSMKVFGKDGGRYTLTINDIQANNKYGAATFTFDESKYPGVHIEDLRID